jgi:transcriptional regulator with XRE-family HTH domain
VPGSPLTVTLAARGVTRDELAKRLGVSAVWIGHICRGARPSPELAERIAGELDVPDPADLFGDPAAVVVSFVKRTTTDSGVPERVADADGAGRIADLLRDAR